MNLNANDLPVFAAVVENNGISAAAKVLGIPKSSVSNAINRLEKALGVRLLERTSRHSHMTYEGEVFYQYSRSVSNELVAAEESMQELKNEPAGRITVALTMAFSRVILGGLLAEFSKRYPKVLLDVIVSNDFHTDLVKEKIDVAIRVGDLPDSDLISTKILETPLIWVSSPAYLAGLSSVPDEREVQENIRVIDKRYADLDIYMVRAEDKISVEVKDVNYINDPLMVIDMVKEGAGFGLVPNAFCLQALREGQLVQLYDDWSVSPVSVIRAVYPSRQYVSLKTRVFIDFLKETAASLLPAD